jgi:hypothetical protein
VLVVSETLEQHVQGADDFVAVLGEIAYRFAKMRNGNRPQ